MEIITKQRLYKFRILSQLGTSIEYRGEEVKPNHTKSATSGRVSRLSETSHATDYGPPAARLVPLSTKSKVMQTATVS